MATVTIAFLKSGKKAYRVRIRMKQADIHKTFRSKSEALRFVCTEEKKLVINECDTITKSQTYSANDLINMYLSHVLRYKKKQTRKIQETQLERWKILFADTKLIDLTEDKISEAKEQLLSVGLGPATINRHLAVLQHVFTFAVKELRWTNNNPVKNIYRMKEEICRDRHLTEFELRRLLLFCRSSKNIYLYAIVLLALSTGARKNEIMCLEWRDIDFDRGRVLMFNHKIKKRVGRTLAGEAMEAMKQLHQQSDPDLSLCFPGCDGTKPVDFRSSWSKVVSRAKLVNFHFHDLRHSCASFMAASGATLEEIARQLDHQTTASTKRYTHFVDTHIRAVTNRMIDKYLPARGQR